ncbi:hypothetical protein D3C73_1510810 [compost metagenome]
MLYIRDIENIFIVVKLVIVVQVKGKRLLIPHGIFTQREVIKAPKYFFNLSGTESYIGDHALLLGG